MFKKEIRVIGIDDAPFRKFSKGKVFVIGTVFRGGTLLDGILSTKVNVDGSNSTKKIIEMVNKSKFKPQFPGSIVNVNNPKKHQKPKNRKIYPGKSTKKFFDNQKQAKADQKENYCPPGHQGKPVCKSASSFPEKCGDER